MGRNIVYLTDQLARHFSRHRIKWEDFYESERLVIGELQLGPRHTVLDVGCGCGGLGLALREQFGVVDYTGVEINQLSADEGRMMNARARILCGDIVDLSQGVLRDQQFDVVFSLSCVDWNVQFADMLTAAWGHVLPGGHLVATFRLTDGQGCADLRQSYQYINYTGLHEGERAPYVVVNARELLLVLLAFEPAEIRCYGYWGIPSATAVTRYERLCFSAFSVRKKSSANEVVRMDLRLPAEVHDLMRPK